jgi:hypothetical protein
MIVLYIVVACIVCLVSFFFFFSARDTYLSQNKDVPFFVHIGYNTLLIPVVFLGFLAAIIILLCEKVAKLFEKKTYTMLIP